MIIEQVILGDNRVTTKEYHDIADRVLLGLLPSSREGWSLAIQLIKPSVWNEYREIKNGEEFSMFMRMFMIMNLRALKQMLLMN